MSRNLSTSDLAHCKYHKYGTGTISREKFYWTENFLKPVSKNAYAFMTASKWEILAAEIYSRRYEK